MTTGLKHTPQSHESPYGSFHSSMYSSRTLPDSPLTSVDLDISAAPRSAYNIDGGSKALTTRESVELFQESVESARHGIQKTLAGTGNAVETLRPKLTVDLNRRNLQHIPSEVVNIIKHDVERLQLAHNQLRSITPDFSTCLALKYLNLRDNRFLEIPPAIFGLPQLEILDLSRNQLKHIPKEIENLRALRVFSIHHNAIEDLPTCLGSITTMRVLKLSENPFHSELREIIESVDRPIEGLAQNSLDENERERLITIKVRDYLRSKYNADGGNFEPMETPRAMSRFPIHPAQESGYQTSGSESANLPRSPNVLKSSRAHQRGPSSQYSVSNSGHAYRKSSGLAPLTLGTERHRSNSELVPPGSQGQRNKRMGIVSKRINDADMLDAGEGQRNSFHLRGQSHSSALRNMTSSHDPNAQDATSPVQTDKGTFVRRLSSVPEQRSTSTSLPDRVVETAKGVLYSLHMVQPYLTSLVALVNKNESRRASLEKYRFAASVQLSHLDQSVVDLEANQLRSRLACREASKTMCKAVHASVELYCNIANLLLRNVRQLVNDGDARYVRTLMLLLYGSINEGRNARRRLGQQVTMSSLQPALATLRPTATKTQIRHETPQVAKTIQTPNGESRWGKDRASVKTPVPAAEASVGLQRTASTYSHASGSAPSRSTSRAGRHHVSGTSAGSTPRSGDSFGAQYLVAHSRNGSASINSDHNRQAQFEQDQFEKIYILLNKAVDQGLQVIPYLEPRFLDNLEKANQHYAPLEIRRLWSTIVSRTRSCGDRSRQLKERLQELQVNDPHARNATDFWRLAMLFVDAYSKLLATLREGRTLNQIDSDLRHRLRPIHKVTLEAGTLIKNSPWNRLTSDSQPPSQSQSRAQTPIQSEFPANTMTSTHASGLAGTNGLGNAGNTQVGMNMSGAGATSSTAGSHRRAQGSGDSNPSTVPAQSPYSVNVPPTPLSAALGPAAQATVPNTPASGGNSSMAGVFEGNVFQRADNLLLQGQTMLFRRPG